MKIQDVIEQYKEVSKLEAEIDRTGGVVLTEDSLPLLDALKSKLVAVLKTYVRSTNRNSHRRLPDDTVKAGTLKIRRWRATTSDRLRSEIAELIDIQ